jgi:hypothetical protein
MATPAAAGFVFLECDGPTGRTTNHLKRLKNRHAQLSNRDARPSQLKKPHRFAVPVQIRFSADPDKGRGRGEKSSNAKSGSVGSVPGDLGLDPSAEGTQSQADLEYIFRRRDTSIILHLPFHFSGRRLQPIESRAMSYFHTYAAIDLSGYLPGHFWDHLVLQISHTEPLLREAIVAVAAAHLDFCTTGTASAAAWTANSRILYSLRQYMSKDDCLSHEVVLCCSVLLFAVSSMLGDVEAAITHLRNGMTILCHARRLQMRHCRAIGPSDPLRRLTAMFIQLDIEGTMQNLSRGALLDLSSGVLKAPYDLEQWGLSARQISPHEAMEAWMYIAHDLWTFISRTSHYRQLIFADVPEHVRNERAIHRARIKAWRRATKGYIKTHPAIAAITLHGAGQSRPAPADITDAISALIIQAHYFVCKCVLAESLQDPEDQKPFDRNPQMLLRTAEMVLALRRMYHGARDIQMPRTFSTHVGIVETLLLLAHRTASPAVRSDAQCLIRQLKDVQHGVSGLANFFNGQGAPPADFVLIFEPPGH